MITNEIDILPIVLATILKKYVFGDFSIPKLSKIKNQIKTTEPKRGKSFQIPLYFPT